MWHISRMFAWRLRIDLWKLLIVVFIQINDWNTLFLINSIKCLGNILWFRIGIVVVIWKLWWHYNLFKVLILSIVFKLFLLQRIISFYWFLYNFPHLSIVRFSILVILTLWLYLIFTGRWYTSFFSEFLFELL